MKSDISFQPTNFLVGRSLDGKRPFLWAQDVSKRHGWLVKKAPIQLGIHSFTPLGAKNKAIGATSQTLLTE